MVDSENNPKIHFKRNRLIEIIKIKKEESAKKILIFKIINSKVNKPLLKIVKSRSEKA